MSSQLSESAGAGQDGPLAVVRADGEWTAALLSCYAPFTTAEIGTIRIRDRDGLVREIWRWRIGWSWLLDEAERQGRLGGQKRKRLGAAVDAMVIRHPGERWLWLRISAPSRELLMRSLHHWRQFRKDHGLELDAVRVIDQGPDGEHVWHVHILGAGVAVDLAIEPLVIKQAGGYPFINAEWVDPGSKRGYLLRRLRGYVGAKESGWRRLRVTK